MNDIGESPTLEYWHKLADYRGCLLAERADELAKLREENERLRGWTWEQENAELARLQAANELIRRQRDAFYDQLVRIADPEFYGVYLHTMRDSTRYVIEQNS